MKTRKAENEKLASKLRYLRMRTGVTQTKVFAETGVHSATLSQYERGCKRPSLWTMQRLADFYCVPVAYLIGANIGKDDERLSGERIRMLRTEKGISQSQLAKATGISAAAISSFEHGREVYSKWKKASILYDYLISIEPAQRETPEEEEKAPMEPDTAPDTTPSDKAVDAPVVLKEEDLKALLTECLADAIAEALIRAGQAIKERS